MWFLSSIFVIVWIIALITFGSNAVWVHALLLVAIVSASWNFLRRIVFSR